MADPARLHPADLESASRSWAAFLAEASRLLSASIDADVILTSLARLVVPSLGDYCVVSLRDEEGDGVRRAGIAHRDPAKEDLLRSSPTIDLRAASREHPVRRVLETGEPMLVTDITPEMIRRATPLENERKMLLDLGPHSVIIVALRVRERVVGSLSLSLVEVGRDYDHADLHRLEELAERASQAVEHALLFRETQAALKAHEHILGVVAHDLRNPLNTIILGNGLLLDRISESDFPFEHKHLEIIHRSAHRMNRLVEDLLEVTRIGKGRLTVERHPARVQTLVAQAAEMLKPMVASACLELKVEIEENLPMIEVDAVRIEQVLSNLIGNAVKFTPEGGRITVAATGAEAGVRLSVQDTGPGISPEQLPNLFASFWQGGHNDALGVGLGLSIAHGIVEAHGGRIWAESEPGQGTTFCFTIPAPDG